MKSSLQRLPGRPAIGLTTTILLVLLALLDARQSLPINPHAAPAPIAWGSGQAPEGAHCTQR